MKNLGYYNGRFDEIENMQVPMWDRASFFGDGVYDATYSRNYKIFNLKEHMDRFFRSAELLRIDIPHTKSELTAIVEELVRKVDTGNNFVYWQVTRGSGIRNHVFPEGNEGGNIWITVTPKEIADTFRRVRLLTMEDTRFFHCNIKTLNLIPAVMASQKAKENGCDEVVFHRSGRVTECAHSNVHIIKNGVFITAPTDNLILAGISRANLIKACEVLGFPVQERPYTLDELFDADEVLVSSAGSLGLAACEIDGRAVGGRASEMLTALQTEVHREFMKETDI